MWLRWKKNLREGLSCNDREDVQSTVITSGINTKLCFKNLPIKSVTLWQSVFHLNIRLLASDKWIWTHLNFLKNMYMFWFIMDLCSHLSKLNLGDEQEYTLTWSLTQWVCIDNCVIFHHFTFTLGLRQGVPENCHNMGHYTRSKTGCSRKLP